MMIRKASPEDIPAIAAAYEELLTFEEANGSASNWKLGVYPTAAVPEAKIPAGEMYVLEEEGVLRASMVLNSAQAVEYRDVPWAFPAEDEKVLVVHTLCVAPSQAGHGYASKMVAYAKDCARERGCRVVRIDTWAYNEPAKSLYQKNGFRIAGYGRSLLQGLIDEDQVFLEWKVEDNE